ncbi:bifunctional 4-hydroxy-2-oxoglutarate aldolase/2-dehydro-3-deoxy-phosphogluconate aldolase [Paenibacillus endoradicis]|uniref:bifunctional 4-hydroxy-2-oxoglutarate aldolase/2-dehydro-3-deoxy-phosphogluconate aldolase n=1 Tax=Paenibacillus endoradicis TaxID=2972487 RepID=UPI00215987AD|nr:bifunctional 4-hydroxy-2-oxoglutarate aldolase/2-dehydro-3-deoxy-phosphogluconate aldolase [Paenibacillus endoradicis]MCR8659544.1 bifunctional 4-hydroxy-2-oxoglutarate aldolase/2-dehydro-3-deoxy-phosphogluconate aldolase [Paenibacillus endoradicis]
MRSALLNELLDHKIIAILRGIEDSYAMATGQAIVDGGIKFMEITMNTDGATHMIHQWRTTFDGVAYVGAGTVIDVDHAKRAITAGAQFLISPNLDIEVVQYAQQHNVPIWPGVMTPTEIIQAMKAGVEAIKLFPMASLGVNYLNEIRGPIKDVPIIATGGVNYDNFRQYFEAGANAVGMGTKLVNLENAKLGKFHEITKQVQSYTTLAATL